MNENKKVAIVTGGATGIGLAISLQLAQDGYVVVVNYNSSAQAAQELVQQIQTNGGQALAVQANLSKVSEAEKLIQKTIETYQRLDVLVNNAGITDDTLMLRMTEAQFDRVIETNLKGVWAMCKFALKPLMQSGNGRIINIASVAGMMGNVGQANYAAAKAGVIGLTKTLAREMASRNLTVNVVAPGFIETNMTAKLSPQIKETATGMIPLKRFGTPEDIAYMVSFLASNKAQYITGQTFVVDGGMTMY
ncbi:MAG: 3-oxoacyl-[acyl-carrier-protein] reductase [Bacilli bacterium]